MKHLIMNEEKLIIGFEYCENEENFIGVFVNEETFINSTKDRKTTEIFDLKREVGNKRLDWGMICTFKTNNFGKITKYGYKLSLIQR